MTEAENKSGLRFLLVRAGSTEFDEQGRIFGSLNIPLSQQGVQEMNHTAKQLIGIPAVAIYSAVCEAAQHSAQLIASQFNLKPIIEPKLTNMNCGLWHGKSIEELRETQPTLFKQWKEHPEQVCPPGGETVANVILRVDATLKKIRRKFKTGIVVVVAPDPLFCFFRNQLQPTQNQLDRLPKLKCGEWELIDSVPVTALPTSL